MLVDGCYSRSQAGPAPWRAAPTFTLLRPGDALTPEHGARIADLVEELAEPERIYAPHFRCVAPGTLAGVASTVQAAGFLRDRPIPFLLFPEHSLRAAAETREMRRDFATAMPCFCLRRDFLQTLACDGAVFHTDRPAEYIATLAMALGHRIIVTPQPLVILGDAAEVEAVDPTLANAAGLLPGPRPHAASLLTMQEAEAALGLPTATPGRDAPSAGAQSHAAGRDTSRHRHLRAPRRFPGRTGRRALPAAGLNVCQ